MKSIIEKAGRGQRRSFISPSLDSDCQVISPSLSFDWKTPAFLLAGAWLLKRYPKTIMLCLVATGIYYGLSSGKKAHPFKGEGIARHLH